MADSHAQLKPLYFREPSINIGVGEARGQLPHLTGRELLAKFGIPAGSHRRLHAELGRLRGAGPTYGRVGGMDRLATVIKAVRAERGAERVLLLDGGDTLQGSYTALQVAGRRHGCRDAAARRRGDHRPLGIHAGRGSRQRAVRRCRAGRARAGVPFLAGNVRDTDFERAGLPCATRMFEKGGVRIAVIGQAFPYTPIANPRWMMPKWTFGLREDDVRRHGRRRARSGAQVVVLLSHNGFDVDRKLARRVEGIDVILTAHTHDALPAPVQGRPHAADRVGLARQVPVAARSGGARAAASRDFAYALIPVLADAITPDADMARADRRHPRPARGDAAPPSWRAPRPCCSGAATSAARSTI